MNPLTIRRATVDDLPALQSLWISMRLPAAQLERRLTEFQVVESSGELVGAIGVEFSRSSVRLHSEGYTDFGVADRAREMFWERIQTLAANHGVFRVWTQEESPFWTRWGFQPANEELLQRLPEEWRNSAAPERSGGWLTLELKNEDAINTALKNQFEMFVSEERKQVNQTLQNARRLKLVITIIGFAIGFIGLGIAFYLMTRQSGMLPQ